VNDRHALRDAHGITCRCSGRWLISALCAASASWMTSGARRIHLGARLQASASSFGFV
jgi:hypothetical protein